MRTGFDIDDAALDAGHKLFRQECKFVRGAAKPSDLAMSDKPEIAFVGRSNVGKSSLINALTGHKALARASNTPGRTQQINFFNLGERVSLVDLPGYGYAKASKTKIEAWNQLMQHYLVSRRALARVCVLIDARHGLRAVDQNMMDMLGEARVPFLAVMTKADKAKRAELEDVMVRAEEDLKAYGTAFPKVYATSSEKGTGIPDLRAVLMLLMQGI